MNLNWNTKKITKAYRDTLNYNYGNEITITKKLYHDPFYFNKIRNLKIQPNFIVDIGCGNGYMFEEIGKIYKKTVLIGIDLEEMLTESIKFNNTTYIKAKSHEVPIIDNSVELVISSLAMHWIKNMEETINEMYRILKSKGKLFISFINPKIFHVGKWDYTKELPQYIINRDISKPQEIEVYINKTIGPIIYYMKPLEYYLNILKKTGFKNIKIYEPTINNKELIKEFNCLKKYINNPLYTFIYAEK